MTAEKKLKRTLRLKDNLLSSRYEICIERMRFFTEAYKRYSKAPENVKRAKAVAHTLQNMTIFIRDDELLVGNETSKNLGEKVNLDLQSFNSNPDRKSAYEALSRRNPRSRRAAVPNRRSRVETRRLPNCLRARPTRL